MSPPAPPSPSSSTSSYIPTTTLLAVPDGPISSSSKDLRSHCTSYLGGYPTFPSLPSTSSSSVPEKVNCGICHSPMPLLTQVYCPPEGGENDRTVYVFACWRGGCQKRDGSVRSFRASVRNEEYVRDVIEKKKEKEKAEAEARAREKELAKVNPFSLNATAATPGNGLGSALFGGSAVSPAGATAFNPFSAPSATDPPTSAFSSLSIAPSTPTPTPASAAAGPSTPSITYEPPIPAYQPAQYLDTFEEYVPRVQEVKEGEEALVGDEGDDDDEDVKKGKGGGGAVEQWERVLPRGVDEVFERFMNRLGEAEGGEEQVLRYDLGSHPLPYSSHSDLYKKLFPKKSAQPGQFQPITRIAHQVSSTDADVDSDDEDDALLHKKFQPDNVVPPCARCGSRRVFEMQLVPGLISSLSPESLTTTGKKPSKKKGKDLSQEDRRKVLAALLAGQNSTSGEVNDETMQSSGGMEWGTVMVFGCETDCVGFGEEWVGVEWEQVGDA